MSDAALQFLRGFYDHLDARRMDRCLEYFHPEAVLTDHRHMASWGGTREDWAAMIEGFLELLPDSKVVRLEVLRAEGGRSVHVVRTRGTDNITGGRVELEFHVVIEGADGLITRCDFFDDEASAVAHYETLAR